MLHLHTELMVLHNCSNQPHSAHLFLYNDSSHSLIITHPYPEMAATVATSKGCRAQSQDTNSLPQQTTAPMVCPRIHHPATLLPKLYLIATNASKPWSCGRQNLIFQRFHNQGNSPKPLVQLLAQQQHHHILNLRSSSH